MSCPKLHRLPRLASVADSIRIPPPQKIFAKPEDFVRQARIVRVACLYRNAKGNVMANKPMPGTDALNTAIAWLEANEGEENGERDACQEVAQWLIQQERERYLRHAARNAGVTVARLRKRLIEQATFRGDKP
jgi:hypothetical protein